MGKVALGMNREGTCEYTGSVICKGLSHQQSIRKVLYMGAGGG